MRHTNYISEMDLTYTSEIHGSIRYFRGRRESVLTRIVALFSCLTHIKASKQARASMQIGDDE